MDLESSDPTRIQLDESKWRDRVLDRESEERKFEDPNLIDESQINVGEGDDGDGEDGRGAGLKLMIKIDRARLKFHFGYSYF